MDKKDKVEIIDGIMKPIEKMGFVKDDMAEDELSWDYLRKRKNGIIQVISIYDNGFYVNMSLSLIGAGNPEYKVAELLDGDNIMDEICGYQYENEAIFKNHISMFKDVLLKKGISLLDNLSDIDLDNSSEVTPQKYLMMEQIQKQIASGRRKLSSLEAICEKLNELEEKPYAKCKVDLLVLAVEYGNWLISMYGGTWKNHKGQYLIHECGKPKLVNPLYVILQNWKRKYRWEISEIIPEHDRQYREL